MIRFLLIFCTLYQLSSTNEIIQINDLFKTLNYNETDKLPKLQDVIIRNISLDLEKQNISAILSKFKGFSFNITDEDELLRDNITRRLNWIGSMSEWNRASRLLVRGKVADLMLQTIYMARHKIKQIENEAYYNPTDTSYRIAFLYRRLRRIWRKIMDVLETMKRKKDHFGHANPFIILHHKAVRLHVDFTYLFWVVIKLHERYDYRHGIPNTTPFPKPWKVKKYKKEMIG